MSDDVFGFDNIIAALKGLDAKFESKSTEMLEDIGDINVEETKLRTPVRTSELKRSFHKGEVEGGGINKQIKTGSNCPYVVEREKGHATKNGGWVEGAYMVQDGFTATQPYFKEKCNELMRETMEDFL